VLSLVIPDTSVSGLTGHSLVGSIGRVGAAANIAATESFFSRLQKNGLDPPPWATHEELRTAIVR
jgi:hypothetical protein